ncbi:MAG: TonB-dependent receptor [Bryobacter sp.]|nr:TonB-dependent receptor [Bryobacter sp. CoA8 C33]
MMLRTLVLLLALVPAALSQEVRASLSGLVTDKSGAPVAGAEIIVLNTATNATLSAASTSAGNYVLPFLPPGKYTLTAQVKGFKKFIRQDIVLQAQDRARVDVELEVGELTQSVTVSGEVSLLETESASRSQVIANELIQNVPTQGRNPFQIAWSAAGVIKTGEWRYLRSFDIGGTTGISINGGRNRENEVLLDGISNVRGDRTVIHIPTMETVQEFKVLTNTYDSQYGRTGGGIVSIVTKGGANQFHGNAFEYFQAEELNANQSELNRIGAKKPPMNINTYGIQASGPVMIPKLFDGRNKLFWLVSYEAMRQRSADPGSLSVPLPEWRTGDFTTLLNAQGAQVGVFDPLTTDAAGNRQQFPGNRIPAARIHPVASNVLRYYINPTSPGEGPARINNYIYPSRWVANMDQWSGRMDYVINSRNNLYFRYGQNPFQEFRGLVWPERSVAESSGNTPLNRNGRNWIADWTTTLNPTTTFNLRAGLARWEEAGGNGYGTGFDPRQLGFADSLVGQFSVLQFPGFNLGSYAQIGNGRPITPGTNDAYTLQPNLSLVKGKHFLKVGGEVRDFRDNRANPGNASGFYNFGKNWTQARANTPDAVSGNELASFLLGLPTAASVDRGIDTAFRNRYYAVFVQDDWKVTSRLTLNLGLRYDYESPLVERYDRMLRGFDFGVSAPITAPGLTLKGGPLFANNGGSPRTSFNRDRNNIQPRVGVAYKLAPKWVLRGGYGLYYLGQNESGATQGFSRTTGAIVSTDGNLTPAVNLTNAFANLPGGRLLAPIGNSLGLGSFLGEGLNINYLDRNLPSSQQYSIDVQHELPGNMLAEAGYVGNRSASLPVNTNINVIPADQMGRRQASGAIDTAYYTTQVPNPMRGLIPNNASKNGANIARQELLLPYPQYGGFAFNNLPIGSQTYDGLQTKLTKRYSRGLVFNSSYTLIRVRERVSLLRAQDYNYGNPLATPLEDRSANQIDLTHKWALAGVWDVPSSPNLSGAARFVLSGWQLNFNITYQSGWNADFPNAKPVRAGSANLGDKATFGRYFDTTLWDDANGRRVSALTPFELRDFPTRFNDVRVPGYQNWDASLAKFFPIRERMRLQFRFEMVNAMNRPWYSTLASGSLDVTNPRFGQLDPTQRNLPRFIKLALNLSW